MIIDIHTHAFTDSIAQRAVGRLAEVAGVAPFTDGTIDGLRKGLSDCGIDYGVILPIATKPTQEHTINDWAVSVSGGSIIGFGTVHPDAEDCLEELERLKSLGLKGLKLHPDYQGFFLFEDKLKPVYKCCEELGLPIIIHMGFDPLSPYVRHAMPSHLAEISEAFPRLKLIGAHLGGMCAWQDVIHYLSDKDNVWIDTSFSVGDKEKSVSAELMGEVIRSKPPERVLFGSDCPWSSPAKELERLLCLGLSDETIGKITSENAIELLQLEI